MIIAFARLPLGKWEAVANSRRRATFRAFRIWLHEVAYYEMRTQLLAEQGWVVYRVWNDDVFKERNAVCDRILLALNTR